MMQNRSIIAVLKYVAAVMSFMLAAVSCSGRKDASSGDVNEEAGKRCDDSLQAYGYSLQMPGIPVAITDPEAMAGYMAVHYWDYMDFNDTAMVADDGFMDRTFAGYFSIFPYISSGYAAQAADVLMAHAEVNRSSYHRVMAAVERFLTSPNSSMRDEETYYLFLQAVDRSDFLDSARRERVKAQIKDVLKNRRGTAAADFAVTDSNGRRTSLYSEAVSGQYRVVIFYDPECSHCHEIIEELKNAEELSAAVTAGRVKVMAVYADGDSDVWSKARRSMPDSWLNCVSPGGAVVNRDIYSLPAMPVIYVMADDNTVVLKDASVPQLMDWLAALQRQAVS